jgi:hypothetical protein
MFRPICAIISLSWTHSVKARGGRGSRQPQTTRPLPLIPRVADTVSSERVAPVFAFVADLVAKVVLHGLAWAGDAQDVSLPSAK